MHVSRSTYKHTVCNKHQELAAMQLCMTKTYNNDIHTPTMIQTGIESISSNLAAHHSRSKVIRAAHVSLFIGDFGALTTNNKASMFYVSAGALLTRSSLVNSWNARTPHCFSGSVQQGLNKPTILAMSMHTICMFYMQVDPGPGRWEFAQQSSA